MFLWLSFLNVFIYVYVCFCLLWTDMHCICGWCLQSSEEGLTALELELQIVMNHQVGSGKQTPVLCKSNNALNH